MKNKIGFIGTVGIPNCYGGFEAFIDCLAPELANDYEVYVTCHSKKYISNSIKVYKNVNLIYISIPANGFLSPLHDFYAFLKVINIGCKKIIILGYSSGPFYIFYRLISNLMKIKIYTNIDGLESRRYKQSSIIGKVLKLFEFFSCKYSDVLIVDSKSLFSFINDRYNNKIKYLPYSGDHCLITTSKINRQVLCISRIVPENNVEMILAAIAMIGEVQSNYIGNWSNSKFGNQLYYSYSNYKNILLKNSIYDAALLNKYRSECSIYIHGHSVGGTNPSLVEILFYDCIILAYDCDFNRETAGNCAHYFSDINELVNLINKALDNQLSLGDRNYYRDIYRISKIKDEFIKIIS